MGISGLVGAGASDGLDEVIIQQLAKQKFAEQIRAQQAQESQQQAEMAQRGEQFSQQMGMQTRRQDFAETQANEEMQQAGIADMRAQQERQRVNLTRLNDEDAAMTAEASFNADPTVPKRVKGLHKAQKLGVKNITDEDFMDENELNAKNQRAIEQARAVADAQAGAAAKYRDRDEGRGQVVDTVDEHGNPIKRLASPEELRTGVKVAPKPRQVSGLERQAKNYFDRAAEAHATVLTLEPEVAQMGLMGQTRMAVAPNWMQSETEQRYRQAQRAFTEARLRKESGAAIPDHEYENDSRTYFAQPGDLPAVQAQKRKARETVLAGIRNEAKRAIAEFETGDADAVDDAPAGPAASSTPTRRIKMDRNGNPIKE